MGNTTNATSKWNDIRVREALEYAIDKTNIAQALGLGFYTPLPQIPPPGQWGFSDNLTTRSYDPAKAKSLLSDAGFPNGCPVTLLCQNDPPDVDAAQSIQQSMNGAGFQVTLDEADPGRYFASVFGTGWSDLLLMFYGMDNNYLMTYISWFSTTPKSNLASFKRFDYQTTFDPQAVMIPDVPGQMAAAEQVFTYMYQQAALCPLWLIPATTVSAKYVHQDAYHDGFIRMDWENVWMASH